MTRLLAEGLIRDVLDFPKPGINFKDITPALLNIESFQEIVDRLVEIALSSAPDIVVGIESRGFILAAPVALAVGAGFVPVRKSGKLPHDVVSASYSLEYGTSTIEIHSDAIKSGQRVLIIDDVLATGGTAAAAATLVEQLQGVVVGVLFLIELEHLNGRRNLGRLSCESLLHL